MRGKRNFFFLHSSLIFAFRGVKPPSHIHRAQHPSPHLRVSPGRFDSVQVTDSAHLPGFDSYINRFRFFLHVDVFRVPLGRRVFLIQTALLDPWYAVHVILELYLLLERRTARYDEILTLSRPAPLLRSHTVHTPLTVLRNLYPFHSLSTFDALWEHSHSSFTAVCNHVLFVLLFCW